MKIYAVDAEYGKMKYWKEHVSFLCPPNYQYHVRPIFHKIRDYKKIHLPDDIVLFCRNFEYKQLQDVDLLKSDFCLPIVSKKLLDLVVFLGVQKYEIFPVNIVENEGMARQIYACPKKNISSVPHHSGFVALYIKEGFDCIDQESSPSVRFVDKNLDKNKTYFDFTRARYLQHLDYPALFKINNINTPYKHFTCSKMKTLILEAGVKGIRFTDVRKAFR